MSLSTAFRLLLPRQIYSAMVAQARSELPNECCGILAAPQKSTPIRWVERQYALINAAASPVLYESDAMSMFKAFKDMRKRGLEIVAIYHSHPTSAPIPSKTDLKRNYSPEIVNFIISLTRDSTDIKGWWLTATEYHPAEWDWVDYTPVQWSLRPSDSGIPKLLANSHPATPSPHLPRPWARWETHVGLGSMFDIDGFAERPLQ